MQVNSNGYNPYVMGAGSTGSSTASKLDGFDELVGKQSDYDLINEIASGGMEGYWSWQVKEMKKKIAEEVMQERNLTADSISKMPASQQAQVKKDIMDEVERRVKLMMAKEAEENQKKQTSGALANSAHKPDTKINFIDFMA